MTSRCCIQHIGKSGRPSNGYGTGKGQSSSQFPRRVVLKSTKKCANHWTIALISHASKVMLKSCMLGFSIIQTKNFQMSKLSLEKGEEEIKLLTFTGSQRKQGNSRKTSTSASLTTLKSLCRSQQTGKFMKRWEYQTTLSMS